MYDVNMNEECKNHFVFFYSLIERIENITIAHHQRQNHKECVSENEKI